MTEKGKNLLASLFLVRETFFLSVLFWGFLSNSIYILSEGCSETEVLLAEDLLLMQYESIKCSISVKYAAQ